MDIEQRARRIKLVVLDVDGVLTDGSIWTGEHGELVKRFQTRDGLGIRMLQSAGIPVAILTGRLSKQTAARCAELGITSVVVTHDLQGALAIADRILLLKAGKVVECSSPDEFVKSQNGDVREFLAAMKGEMS